MNQQISQVVNLIRTQTDIALALANPLERLNEVFRVVQSGVGELNAVLKDFEFADKAEEIEFFKEVKPQVIAVEIEEGIKYSLQVNQPVGTPEALLQFYEDQLKSFHSFFEMNAFHYKYFKNGFTELDTLFFLRNGGPLPVPLTDIPLPDDGFSTPMSYLFARFIAYDRLQHYILEVISLIKYPEMKQPAAPGESGDLSWTGDLINVVELAYGLWLTGQLNHGNASLNQIVRWLELNLNINIGIVQRRFNEISRRKRLSLTKFIDKMRESVLKKIDDDQK